MESAAKGVSVLNMEVYRTNVLKSFKNETNPTRLYSVKKAVCIYSTVEGPKLRVEEQIILVDCTSTSTMSREMSGPGPLSCLPWTSWAWTCPWGSCRSAGQSLSAHRIPWIQQCKAQHCKYQNFFTWKALPFKKKHTLIVLDWTVFRWHVAFHSKMLTYVDNNYQFNFKNPECPERTDFQVGIPIFLTQQNDNVKPLALIRMAGGIYDPKILDRHNSKRPDVKRFFYLDLFLTKCFRIKSC